MQWSSALRSTATCTLGQARECCCSTRASAWRQALPKPQSAGSEWVGEWVCEGPQAQLTLQEGLGAVHAGCDRLCGTGTRPCAWCSRHSVVIDLARSRRASSSCSGGGLQRHEALRSIGQSTLCSQHPIHRLSLHIGRKSAECSTHADGALQPRRGFFGCKHFSEANRYLEGLGKAPIKWQN